MEFTYPEMESKVLCNVYYNNNLCIKYIINLLCIICIMNDLFFPSRFIYIVNSLIGELTVHNKSKDGSLTYIDVSYSASHSTIKH